MRLDEIAQRGRAVNARAVVATDHIARLQTRFGCGRVRLHFLDDRRLRGINQDLPRALPLPAARFGFVGRNREGELLPVAVDLERNRLAFAPDHIPNHAVVHPREPRHRLSIHFQNLITREQTRLGGGRILFDVTDGGRHVGFVYRMTDDPDDGREEEREQEAEDRPRQRHDDFIERGDRRKLRPIHIRFALDDIHGRELRELHEPAKRDRA